VEASRESEAEAKEQTQEAARRGPRTDRPERPSRASSEPGAGPPRARGAFDPLRGARVVVRDLVCGAAGADKALSTGTRRGSCARDGDARAARRCRARRRLVTRDLAPRRGVPDLAVPCAEALFSPAAPRLSADRHHAAEATELGRTGWRSPESASASWDDSAAVKYDWGWGEQDEGESIERPPCTELGSNWIDTASVRVRPLEQVRRARDRRGRPAARSSHQGRQPEGRTDERDAELKRDSLRREIERQPLPPRPRSVVDLSDH